MNIIIAVLFIGTASSVMAGSITSLDVKKPGGGSYCTQTGCKVPSGTTVYITFTINVDSPVEGTIWTAKEGKNRLRKAAFRDWHICPSGSGSNLVLQETACPGKTISKGVHQVSAAVKFLVKTNGKLIVGENKQKYVSNRLPITIY